MFTFAHAGRGNRPSGDKFELQEAAPKHTYIHTYIHTSRQKYFHFVNCVLRYHFGQKRGPGRQNEKIDAVLENPKSPCPWQGPRF